MREDATALCAPSLCKDADRPGFRDRMRSLWDDLSLVYAHEVLPDDLERELPSVTETWGDFNGGLDTSTAVADTRSSGARPSASASCASTPTSPRAARGASRSSSTASRAGGAPRLHLIHILLPHVPFQYLPSGRFYRRSPKEALTGLDGRPGYGIPFVVEQAYQRHLLQLQATDRLLGELLDRLHEVGIYDRAVVGGGGRPRDQLPARPRPAAGAARRTCRTSPRCRSSSRRPARSAAGSATGRCRRSTCCRRSRTCSACDIPWKVDGRSALAPPKPRRREIIAKKFKHTYLVDTPAYESAKRAALARKLRLFGGDIYAFGPRPDLIGRSVPAGGRDVVVDPASGFIPAHVAGTIPDGRRGGGRTRGGGRERHGRRHRR